MGDGARERRQHAAGVEQTETATKNPAAACGSPRDVGILLTQNSAFSLRFDVQAGCLSAGRPASLAVLSGDLREVAPHRISEVDTVITLFEGEAVFGSRD